MDEYFGKPFNAKKMRLNPKLDSYMNDEYQLHTWFPHQRPKEISFGEGSSLIVKTSAAAPKVDPAIPEVVHDVPVQRGRSITRDTNHAVRAHSVPPARATSVPEVVPAVPVQRGRSITRSNAAADVPVQRGRSITRSNAAAGVPVVEDYSDMPKLEAVGVQRSKNPSRSRNPSSNRSNAAADVEEKKKQKNENHSRRNSVVSVFSTDSSDSEDQTLLSGLFNKAKLVVGSIIDNIKTLIDPQSTPAEVKKEVQTITRSILHEEVPTATSAQINKAVQEELDSDDKFNDLVDKMFNEENTKLKEVIKKNMESDEAKKKAQEELGKKNDEDLKQKLRAAEAEQQEEEAKEAEEEKAYDEKLRKETEEKIRKEQEDYEEQRRMKRTQKREQKQQRAFARKQEEARKAQEEMEEKLRRKAQMEEDLRQKVMEEERKRIVRKEEEQKILQARRAEEEQKILQKRKAEQARRAEEEQKKEQDEQAIISKKVLEAFKLRRQRATLAERKKMGFKEKQEAIRNRHKEEQDLERKRKNYNEALRKDLRVFSFPKEEGEANNSSKNTRVFSFPLPNETKKEPVKKVEEQLRKPLSKPKKDDMETPKKTRKLVAKDVEIVLTRSDLEDLRVDSATLSKLKFNKDGRLSKKEKVNKEFLKTFLA